MHIEPGVVNGAKLLLSYGTAAGCLGGLAKLAWGTIKNDGITQLAIRSMITTLLVFCFFPSQVLY